LPHDGWRPDGWNSDCSDHKHRKENEYTKEDDWNENDGQYQGNEGVEMGGDTEIGDAEEELPISHLERGIGRIYVAEEDMMQE
jgi:hypothetical protein